MVRQLRWSQINRLVLWSSRGFIKRGFFSRPEKIFSFVERPFIKNRVCREMKVIKKRVVPYLYLFN